MILPDVNVPVHAHREDAVDYARFWQWLEEVIRSGQPFGLSGHVLSGFLRSNTGDHRLQEIKNSGSNSAVISQFDYTYDAVSPISRWAENNPSLSGSESYNFGYDGSDELGTAQLSATSGVVNFYAYSYDAAENRLSSQANSVITSVAVNDLNQLTSGTSGGPLLLSGTLDEPAAVTIGGISGTNTATLNGLTFSGTTAVTTGSNLINAVATDSSNQATTHQYRVTVPAASGTYTFDSDGNLTNDGVMTYQWDAANRLTVVNETGTTSSNFTYDGFGRRAIIVEKTNGTVTSTKNLIWCGNELCEERDASDNVTKRYYPQGVQLSGTDYYYTRDHLGSIRELADANSIVQARYDYDPYGQQTQLSGTLSADIGYAGYYEHRPSALLLAGARGYRPSIGRWLSRDPIEEDGGVNLYEMVKNNPISLIDLFGLRDLNSNEQDTISKLSSLEKNVSSTSPDLAKGIAAVIAYLRSTIAGIKHDQNDPIQLKVTEAALAIWGDKNQASAFLDNEATGDYKCNLYVAKVLKNAGVSASVPDYPSKTHRRPPIAGDWFNTSLASLSKFKVVYELRKKGGTTGATLAEWDQPTTGQFKPGFGNIVILGPSGGNGDQNDAHVGISLGNDLFVSATILNVLGGQFGVAIKYIVPTYTAYDKIIYRSVPSQ